MTHTEKCLCGGRELEFRSDFDGDVVTKVYCPACTNKAPGDAIIFELCEPGEFAGVWGVRYNAGELKRLDPAFRNDDGYFLSLLISGVCGPAIARHYKKTGLCRIFGFKQGPTEAAAESALSGKEEALASEEGAIVAAEASATGRKATKRKSRKNK